MKFKRSNNKQRSLGVLGKNKCTTPRAPDLVGHVNMQEHTLAEIVKQFKQAGGTEVPCNIAAWKTKDKNGATILSVEISPWGAVSKPHKEAAKPHNPNSIFDSLFGKEEDD